MEHREPLLFMDVDGVLNPYPDCPEGYEEHVLFPGDHEPVRLCALHGDWLRELAARFTIVWATGWRDEANRILAPYFGLPELASVVFPAGPFDPAMKLAAIDAFAAERPLAWVDDLLPAEAHDWADGRTATLLVPVDHLIGLTRAHVDRLLGWAR